MIRTRELAIIKLTAAGAIGLTALTACGGEAAPKHDVAVEQSHEVSPSDSPSATPTETATPSETETTPSVTYSFSQDQINQLENQGDFSDEQVIGMEKDYNLIAQYPDLLAKAAVKGVPSTQDFRAMAEAFCLANETAFKTGNEAILHAMFGETTAHDFQPKSDAQMNTLIANKSSDALDKVTDYSCSFGLANDPAHVPALADTPRGQSMAQAPDQVLEDEYHNALVAGHMTETVTYASGKRETLRNEDLYLDIYTQPIQGSDGELYRFGNVAGLYNRTYYQNQG